MNEQLERKMHALESDIAELLDEAVVKMTRLTMLVRDNNITYKSPSGEEFTCDELDVMTDNLDDVNSRFFLQL